MTLAEALLRQRGYLADSFIVVGELNCRLVKNRSSETANNNTSLLHGLLNSTNPMGGEHPWRADSVSVR